MTFAAPSGGLKSRGTPARQRWQRSPACGVLRALLRGSGLGRALALSLVLLAAVVPGLAQDEEGRLPGGQMLRGTVSAVAEGRFTLKSETGTLYQVTATTNTRIMRERQPAKLTDIKVGDGVGAGGILDDSTKTLHAAFIALIDAEQVRKLQAELGKSYILGKVTAIDELKLTIRRPDGVSQVIAVDEGTSFRRGGRSGGTETGGGAEQSANQPPTGESITLADVKVGESVGGRGALKNGVFVPTELHVMVPDPNRHRRDSAAGNGAQP